MLTLHEVDRLVDQFVVDFGAHLRGEDPTRRSGAKVGILGPSNDFKEKADVSIFGIPSGCYRL
jgi:hypothetical protein